MSELDWRRVAEAHTHPLRLQILGIIEQPPPDGLPGWSPAMISRTLEQPLGTISYHVKGLSRLGLLVPVGSRAVRGAVEHFYAPR